MKKFPKGFLWGASTSAHQVEGGNHNDWSEWEKKNADRLAREAKNYWEDWQQEKFPEMFDSKNYISGHAADHYNLYEKDFDLMKELGMNAYRFSIEWSRIEPKEGKFDEREIEHYRKVVRALRKRGIEPFVTLWHWTAPTWFRDSGGWHSKGSAKKFARYAEKISDALKDDVEFWITINEPMVYTTLGYLKGIWPPNRKSLTKYFRAIGNLIDAHKLSRRAIRKQVPGAQVGLAKNNVYYDSAGGPINWFLVNFVNWLWNHSFLNRVEDRIDFIGLNHYFHKRIRAGFSHPEKWLNNNENKVVSDLGHELYPEAMYKVLKDLERYGKPIYITENGLADAGDEERAEFIEGSLEKVWSAIADGVDVRGYLHWSLIDNFEWDKGFWPRFGLIEVDFKTQKRTVRGSAKEYAKIIRANALE